EWRRFVRVVDYGEFRIGGTSLSSPLMAGMFALSADLRNAPLGFGNPVLYTVPSARSTIRDVGQVTTKGIVRVDFANGESGTNLFYTVRTLDFETSSRNI